jgi:serine palmitoyltransferase
MPTSSPFPSPMAINKAQKSSSIFKKRSANGLVGGSPLPASAVSYLSALSQADAQARARSVSPTSTPALSLSSSITSSSEDTILHEHDDDNSSSNTNGLLYPARPPTSEQIFTTVHTEFGHCADEQYRTTSQHKPGTPLPTHIEQDPPYYILLSTYISYLILICLGHVRDFMGKRLYPARYHHLMPRNVSSLPC